MEKVLIVTYYWPPAGGPGVQRWLKFVKYLRDYHLEPVVYIPEDPDYPLLDETFLNEVPEDIEIIKGKIFEPYGIAKLFSKKQTSKISSGIIAEDKNQNFLQKLMLYIRGNFFIPDARKYWIKPSVKILSAYIIENKITKIITTGPPHSVHLIGLKLKEQIDLKWFADFRDPWTQIGYHKKLKLTRQSQRKHLKLESKVLNKADEIIVTSFTTREEFQNITSKPVTVITNGYEEISEAEISLDKKFSISHIGSLLSGRDPKILWQVLRDLVAEDLSFEKDFKLKLAGTVSEDVISSIKYHGLENNLQLLGYVSHEDALKLQRSSQLLLLIEIDSDETKGIIPGKLFEYLAAQRPIIAIGPEGWDVSRILLDTQAGNCFQYLEKDRLKAAILNYYSQFKEGSLQVNPKNIEHFSRKQLTGQLAQLIKGQ
jgi:glycosyltransferase involved in cell wall biosynthesis